MHGERAMSVKELVMMDGSVHGGRKMDDGLTVSSV